jgi:hypothetical protein
MGTAVIFLVVMTIIAMSDLFIALRNRQLADTDDREALGKIDPDNARRIAAFMLVFSPLLFIGAVLVSFGKIPVGGIDPIKF